MNFNKKKSYIFYIVILTPLVIYSVYLTGERANFLSLVFVIFIIFGLFKFKKIFFCGDVLFYVNFSFLFFDQLKEFPKFDRMLTKNINSIQYVLSKNKGEDFLYKNNVYFSHYSTALQVFQDYPINGVGLKNFRYFCNNPKYDEKIFPEQRTKKCKSST